MSISKLIKEIFCGPIFPSAEKYIPKVTPLTGRKYIEPLKWESGESLIECCDKGYFGQKHSCLKHPSLDTKDWEKEFDVKFKGWILQDDQECYRGFGIIKDFMHSLLSIHAQAVREEERNRAIKIVESRANRIPRSVLENVITRIKR